MSSQQAEINDDESFARRLQQEELDSTRATRSTQQQQQQQQRPAHPNHVPAARLAHIQTRRQIGEVLTVRWWAPNLVTFFLAQAPRSALRVLPSGACEFSNVIDTATQFYVEDSPDSATGGGRYFLCKAFHGRLNSQGG
jgi:hypothetical protein